MFLADDKHLVPPSLLPILSVKIPKFPSMDFLALSHCLDMWKKIALTLWPF